MKKLKTLSCCVSLCLATICIASVAPANAFAAENLAEASVAEAVTPVSAEEKKVVAKSVQSIFENKAVSACETLYNLDGSADYISVELEGGGYAVFTKRTMELLEYSPEGALPYEDNVKKYYAGPASYLQKADGAFVDAVDGEALQISSEEAVTYAKQVRETLVEQKITENRLETFEGAAEEIVGQIPMAASAPDIDTDNLITPTGGFDGLIPNYEYFLAEPTIGYNITGEKYGNNNTGTCGPVAAQLLLSYNNYYNDRRIIPDRYLLGYDDATNSVTDKEKNPNYCTDPMLMDKYTTGTRSESKEDNSFFYKMISLTMDPGDHGTSNQREYHGISAYLLQALPKNGYVMEAGQQLLTPIKPLGIVNEISAGRPVIISLDKRFNGTSNHFVVGYGRQSYTYPNNQGTYDGYVVHFGWHRTGSNCVWINSSWCNGYIALKINHTHVYSQVGAIGTSNRTESKCVECGYRTDPQSACLQTKRTRITRCPTSKETTCSIRILP